MPLEVLHVFKSRSPSKICNAIVLRVAVAVAPFHSVRTLANETLKNKAMDKTNSGLVVGAFSNHHESVSVLDPSRL